MSRVRGQNNHTLEKGTWHCPSQQSRVIAMAPILQAADTGRAEMEAMNCAMEAIKAPNDGIAEIIKTMNKESQAPTELDASSRGYGYKRGAPNGA